MASTVYDYDLSSSDIEAAVAFMTIDAESDPTATQVDEWVQEACADVNAELEAQGVTPSGITASADANLYYSIRGRVIAWVSGRLVGEKQRSDPAYVQAKREEWGEFLRDIRRRPSKRLGSSGITTTASSFTDTITETVPTRLQGSSRWFK